MVVGIGNPNQIKKWKKQRSERGFSDLDVVDIDEWFLTIVPEIIDEFIKHCQSYPSWMEHNYRKNNGLGRHTLTSEQQNRMDKACMKKWISILKKMQKSFIVARESNFLYSHNNPNRKRALNLFIKYFDDLWC